MSEQRLRNQVAVVAGAMRGAGRGVARMLGAAGASVRCTGHSVWGRPATPGRPETIEETAVLLTAEWGRGIAVAKRVTNPLAGPQFGGDNGSDVADSTASPNGHAGTGRF